MKDKSPIIVFYLVGVCFLMAYLMFTIRGLPGIASGIMFLAEGLWASVLVPPAIKEMRIGREAYLKEYYVKHGGPDQ